MKKVIWRIVVIVLALIVVAGIVVVLSLDSIVKKGIETVGPNVTKVPVTVDSVHISLLGASGKVKGLVVGNPEGYKSPHAISVGTAAMALKIGSILSDKVVIKSIELREPEIILEGTVSGILHRECNLTKILDNVEGTPTGTNAPPVETTPGQLAKKLEVDDFIISGAKMIVQVQGVSQGLTVPIPEIHLTNLGTGEGGITAGELIKRVLQQVVSEALKAGTSAVNSIGKEAIQKEAGKAVDNAKEKITEGLDNLLKKKK